jgi:hypothetical protein
MFRVKTINEAFFKDLQVEYFVNNKAVQTGSSGVDLSIGEMLTYSMIDSVQLRKFGRIQQVVIDDFRLMEISAEERRLERVVTARHAVFDVRKKKLAMTHAQVELPLLKRRLSAPQLVWHERLKQWEIDKQAILWDRDKKMTVEHVRLSEQLDPIY